MFEEKATIVAIDENTLTLKSQVKSTCSSCHQADSCGSGQVANALPHKALVTKIETENAVIKTLHVGDEVMIGIPEHDVLITAWQVYLWPIIGLILFAGIGQWLFIEHYIQHEFLGIILAGIGGYLGFYFAKLKQNTRNNQSWLQPKLLSICPKNIPITHL